ncbi:MAG TPA: hypothetical protein PLT68_07105 [Actinomycetota bacterium]|nr:hypothetical protein [Actinomycetota bacterium]
MFNRLTPTGRCVSAGMQTKQQAAGVLNGSTGEWQIRTVTVAEQDIPGYHREATRRLDVREVRGKK